MKGHMYNIDNGYLEGLCRGFKNGILKQADYLNLVQCETLEGERDLRSWNKPGSCVSSLKSLAYLGAILELFRNPVPFMARCSSRLGLGVRLS